MQTTKQNNENAAKLKTIDVTQVNKFENDGTFLKKIMEANKIQSSVKKVKNFRNSKKHTKQNPKSECKSVKKSLIAKDPVKDKAEKEFLCAMKIMEEAGLITEKGLGAGMVK